MTTNDLMALLNEARNELAILASYVGHEETRWPNVGLKVTAATHKKLVERIDAALAAEPSEDIPLRRENLALRAALRVRWSDEAWRKKYLLAEDARVKAQMRLDRLEWEREAACENTPTNGCECPGCSTARERALLGEA